MNIYKKVNTLLGWFVFAIASTVYIITSEPTMSFWDCGEYISTAFKLEVGHPPGAPLFQLIGRFFSLFAFGDVKLVARMVNTMSALCSGLTIAFLFWSITLIAKKILLKKGEITQPRMLMIMGAGLIGSLAYTFTDSFWFSAVEGEVYAMSSFFTAVVFWSILKWDEQADEPHSHRWILLIAYLVGLSIGVHMLNLLTIPALTFVYYFRKHPSFTWKGFFATLVVSVVLLAIVMYVIIPGVVSLAGWFELFFVNSFGLPFNWGTLIYFVLLTGLLVWGLIYTRKKTKVVMNTILLSLVFILIGYTSFLMLVIRSNAETPLDENNPENAMYLLSYLNREQYGDWPILKGPYYNAPVIDRKDGNPTYTKNRASGKYVITDKKEKSVSVYDPRFTTIFPRMWSSSEKKHAEEYIRWGKVTGVPIQVQSGEQTETLNKPTFGENLRFFWNYQVVHMYYRYFMWNFAGKQNDNQGLGNKIDGNWKSGIPFIDKSRLGPQENAPASASSRGDNKFYFLPLILGLIGLYFTIRQDKKSAWVIFLLFFMTGFAIILYLNQYAPQPRERDYAYVGSFYAFAIWIGLGVIQLSEWLGKVLKPANLSPVIVTVVTLLCVPCLMAQQCWDDHDRSGRRTALAVAMNYLNSCAPHAILFTFGDNDTFPLWYAQEVEGIRTDVRVVNLSLLNMDWCVDQIKRKAYDSDPLPVSLTWDRYHNGDHDITYIMEQDQFKNGFTNLHDIYWLIENHEDKLKLATSQYGTVDFIPTRNFMIPCNPDNIKSEGLVPSKYWSRLDTMKWTFKGQGLQKNDLILLDIVSNNNWKRPIYFTATMSVDPMAGLDKFLFLEGLTYRVLPVNAKPDAGQMGEVNTDVMYNNMMNKFYWGNIQNLHVYIDEQNQRTNMNYRNSFARLANALISEGKRDSARRVLDRCIEVIPEKQSPYDYFMAPVAEGYFKIGETSKGLDIASKIFKGADQSLYWYCSFPSSEYKNMEMYFQEQIMTLQKLGEIMKETGQDKDPLYTKVSASFQRYYQFYVSNIYQRSE
ncbi:MAG: DUF2723 domain-containing protein [Bacteroidota bacterium]|nr:DUF2723 domain-containing protein [Bacteroidota bacterium]